MKTVLWALCALCAALPLAALAQGAPPPDVQAIMDKARSGQRPTPEEIQRLRQWGAQMRQAPADPAAMRQHAMQERGVSPDLIPIFQKKHRGEPLTPEEQQKLDDYMQSRMAAHAAPGPDGRATGPGRAMQAYFMTKRAVPAASGVDVSQRPRLDLGGYLALVKKIRADTAASIGPDLAQRLDRAAGRDPRRAQALGVALTFLGAAPGEGAYLLAGVALKEPKDARTASNLSVAAYAGNFFEAAYDLATWGGALAPGSATLLCNRAWPAMYLGDFKTAEALFRQALAKNVLPDPYSGLALLAKARGDKKQAMIMAAGAIAHGSGSFVDASMGAEEKAHETTEQRAQDTPIEDRGGGSAGGVIYDLNAPSQLDYPTWTIDADPTRAIEVLPAYQAWLQKQAKRIEALGKQKLEVEKAYVASQEQKAAQGTLHWPRRNPRILTELSDLQSIYQARAQLIHNDWEPRYLRWTKAAVDDFNRLTAEEDQAWAACPPEPSKEHDPCMKRVQHEYCLKKHAAAKSIHGAAGDDFGQHQVKMKSLMEEFWKKSQPLVDGIADPGQQEVRVLERRFFLQTSLMEIRQGVDSWLSGVYPMAVEVCDEPPPPAKQDDVDNDAKEPANKKGQCFPPPNHCGLGPVDLSWDCNGFTVQGGEGLFAGVSVKFAGDDGKGTLSGHTETTLFAGFGDEISAGHSKGEAKAVISFTQAQGQVVDVGAEFATGAEISGYGSKAETGTDLTWSMRSGANMNWQAGASWQGQELGKIGD